jgi:integrase
VFDSRHLQYKCRWCKALVSIAPFIVTYYTIGMGRYREDYTLYERPNGYWYVRYYVAAPGKDRRVAKALGTKDKRLAKERARTLFQAGQLSRRQVTLEDYVIGREFFVWGKCRYIKNRLAASPADRPAISKRYAADARRYLSDYIVRAFGPFQVKNINHRAIEMLRDSLHDGSAVEGGKGLSRKTVNNVMSVFRTVLQEAVRDGVIDRNPFDHAILFKTESKEREILSPGDARKVLERKHWKHDVYWLINVYAAVTGARQGELLALTDETYHGDWIEIKHSWHIKHGLGPTKSKRDRKVPIPRFLQEWTDDVVTWKGFLFSLSEGTRPFTPQRMVEQFYKVLDRLEIDREGITFHSWRHWHVTMLRNAGTPDREIQATVGHAGQEMTEHYSHQNARDFKDVIAAQEKLIG